MALSQTSGPDAGAWPFYVFTSEFQGGGGGGDTSLETTSVSAFPRELADERQGAESLQLDCFQSNNSQAQETTRARAVTSQPPPASLLLTTPRLKRTR